MDVAAAIGGNPVTKHRFSLSTEMRRLTRDGTAETVSRDQTLRHKRGQGKHIFPCSADHEQDWQPYPVDPYSAICDDHTYIYTFNIVIMRDDLRVCLHAYKNKNYGLILRSLPPGIFTLWMCLQVPSNMFLFFVYNNLVHSLLLEN